MATCTFTGTTDSHWNDNGNWDGDVPTAADDAVFNADSPSCLVDATAVAKTINCTGYVQTLTLGANLTVSGSITLVSGMTFTPSTYKVTVNATSTIASGGKSFYLFDINSNSDAVLTLSDDLTIANAHIITGATGVNYTINGNNINAKGDVTISTNVQNISGTTAFKINGSGNQTISLGSYSATTSIKLPITFASTGGVVTFAAGTHRIGGNLTLTSGTIDFTTNSSTVIFNNNVTPHTISGAYTFYNLSINNHTDPTFTFDSAITVNGDFVYGQSGSSTILNGGSIDVKGNFTITSGARNQSGTTTFTLSGSGTQTLNLQSAGSTLYCSNDITITNSGIVNFADVTHYYSGNLVFNGTGTYNLVGTLSYKTGTITYTAGTVNPGTSILSITDSCTLSTNGMSWYHINLTNGTLTLSSALQLTGNWTKTAGTTLTGNYNVTFSGSATSTLAGATTFNGLQLAAGKSCYLTASQLFSVGTFNAIGLGNSQISLLTSSGGTTSWFRVTTIGTVRFVRATDINSAAGSQVIDIGGTLSNTTNWATWMAGDTYWVCSQTANDQMDGYVDGALIMRLNLL